MRALAWLVWRELRAEWRGREAVAAAALFSLVELLTFGFALDPVEHDLDPLFPGLVVTATAFTAVLVLERSFAREREAGGYENLAVLPVDRALVIYAKAAAVWVVLAGLQALTLPLLVALLRFDRPLAWPAFLAVLALGTAGLALAGTLVAAMAAHGRASGSLLPVLLLPLVLPVVLAMVRAGIALMVDPSIGGEAGRWFRLLVGYDMVFSVIPLVVADALLEA